MFKWINKNWKQIVFPFRKDKDLLNRVKKEREGKKEKGRLLDLGHLETDQEYKTRIMQESLSNPLSFILSKPYICLDCQFLDKGCSRKWENCKANFRSLEKNP